MTEPHVLLVEDNEDDIDLTLLAFKRAGMPQVIVARDGVEALDYLFGQGGRASAPATLPKAIFLDIHMPRLDGIEVLRAIRAEPRTAKLPVVVLTSSKEPRDVDDSYASGANSYVRKVIDVDDFQSLVEQLGRYWLQLNEVAG